MLRRLLLVAIVITAAGLAVFWWLTIPAVIPANALPTHMPNLANGLATFNAGGRSSCHAVPAQPDRMRLGGGLPIPSPFGTFYVPNISPDMADGIGRWSEADFVTAVVKGTSPRGTHYFPAFPYTSYQHARLEDLRDLFAYLKTLPPVSGRAPEHQVPFPFNIRRNVGVWKFLFLDGKPFTPDASRSAQWNRGAYLINSLGHCAECHSPRNFLGGIIAAQRFAGGPNPEGEGWVPNITQKGLGGLVREGHRLFPRERPDARWRYRRRLDGSRDQEHLAVERRRSCRHGGLSQIGARGRRAAAAQKARQGQILKGRRYRRTVAW